MTADELLGIVRAIAIKIKIDKSTRMHDGKRSIDNKAKIKIYKSRILPDEKIPIDNMTRRKDINQ